MKIPLKIEVDLGFVLSPWGSQGYLFMPTAKARDKGYLQNNIMRQKLFSMVQLMAANFSDSLTLIH